MKTSKSSIYKYLPLTSVLAILGMIFFSPSCANTTTPPSGGDKDTIPPVIVNIKPLPGTVNVPRDSKIYITFDEYVTVKDPNSIFLSPPLEKKPKFKMRGKTLIVYFESKLDSNTTYTLDLTNAIADNNEGNMYPGYTLVFSTGSKIDSMALTGTVRDCNTLQPIKGATVLLYKDLADSAVFLHRPDAAVKTDDWGFFSLRNIADTSYRLYAVMEETPNNIYNPETDRVAFIDSIIRPVIVAHDTIPELLKYDMKDTVHCMARHSEYELYMFKENPSKQMISNKERTGSRSAFVKFMAANARIDSLWIKNIPSKNLIMQFNPQRDSLEIWINDRRRLPDTLHVFVDYMKTDSTGLLKPELEHLRLAHKDANKSRTARRNLKAEDTTCVFKINATPETVEQKGFEFEFKYPIINQMFDSVSLKSVNPRQQEKMMNFSIRRDSLDIRKFILTPDEKLQTGYDYILHVPKRKFRDINGYYNDSTEVKLSLPKDDKLSMLILELSNVKYRYIIDLLNDSRDKVLRTYIVDKNISLTFPYLQKGKYSIRLTEDLNANGMVDTGVILEKKQPEKVKFFKLRNDSYVLEIPEGTELTQNIDVEKLFTD